MNARKSIGVALAATLLAGFFHLGTAAAATPEEDLIAAGSSATAAKLGPWLANVHEEYQNSSNKRAFRSRNSAIRMQGGMVGVDLYANDAAGLQRSLAQLGARNVKTHGPLVSAQVPISALGQLAALPTLRFAIPALAKVRVASQGDVVSQGDVSLGSNTVRSTTGLDGSGVTVGVMSDSYQCNPPPFVPGAPTTTAAQDEATPGRSAGRRGARQRAVSGKRRRAGMVQLVHDVAPGSAQKFQRPSTAWSTSRTAYSSCRRRDPTSSWTMSSTSRRTCSPTASSRRRPIWQSRPERHISHRPVIRRGIPTSPRTVKRRCRSTAAGTRTAMARRSSCRARFRSRRRHRYATEGSCHARRSGEAMIMFSLQWDQPFLSSTAFAQADGPEQHRAARCDRRSGHAHLHRQGCAGAELSARPSTGITCQLAGTRNIGGDAVDITLLFVGGPKSKTNDFFIRIARVAGQAPAHVKYVDVRAAGHDRRAGARHSKRNGVRSRERRQCRLDRRELVVSHRGVRCLLLFAGAGRARRLRSRHA